MQVTDQIDLVRKAVAEIHSQGKSVGFVPTMGALHAGHVSLLRTARQKDDFLIASIFLNPTQFGPGEDLSRYPQPLKEDLGKCASAGVDLVFQPPVDTMYREGAATTVQVHGLTEILEGARRPGHFQGVATVVTKLFNIVEPNRAYFGQKDYQQQLMIRQMVRDLDLPIEVVTCPTVRESDGLAMSSRNTYLNAAERQTALVLSQTLQQTAETLFAPTEDLNAIAAEFRMTLENASGIDLEYAVIADPVSLQEVTHWQPHMILLTAARVGTTRLIDNWVVQPE